MLLDPLRAMRRGQGSEGLAQAQFRAVVLASMGRLVLKLGSGYLLKLGPLDLHRDQDWLKLGPGHVFRLERLD